MCALLYEFCVEKYTVDVFIDLLKAFDTVNHQILLSKLNIYGTKGTSLSWFESYLPERKQYIQVGKQITFLQDITCGVPQGIILGPLLFLLYINDIFKAYNIVTPIMLADDTYRFHSILSFFQQDKDNIPLKLPTFTTDDVPMNQNILEFTLTNI